MVREELTPKKIVAELDNFIIGQQEAKKCVAVALRNRYRRQRLPEALREEITPKNIILIGPTGVGKTEIARRLAKLVNAPFVKVEATKFTEVGYVGRDVETMVRDLVETAVRAVQSEKMSEVAQKAARLAEGRLLDLLAPAVKKERGSVNPFSMFFSASDPEENEADPDFQERWKKRERERDALHPQLSAGLLEQHMVELEVEERAVMEPFSGTGMDEMGINVQDILTQFMPKRKKSAPVTCGRSA
jgi:ATP-dependent HslUV protease ATP-binding subunit HslU